MTSIEQLAHEELAHEEPAAEELIIDESADAGEEIKAPLVIPEGFFDEVAAQLATESPEEIADVVIATCISRGILHPELDDEPADELRAEEISDVFTLLDAVTAAVADGHLIARRLRYADDMDPAMEQAWDAFADAAHDADAANETARLLYGSDDD